MSFFRMLLFLLIFAFVNCVKADPNPSLIVGGTIVSLTSSYQYQHQVSIAHFETDIQGKIKKTLHFCGGSIISTEWVLTAAHCVDKETTNTIVVRAGSLQRDRGGLLYHIAHIVINPHYDSNTLDYDIAVLKVSRRILMGAAVRIIHLPDLRSKELPSGRALVTGWGYKQESGYSARKLRAAFVHLKKPELCKELYGESFTDRMICAGGGRKDSCQGDSGGPLVVNDIQIGIVSWGFGCGRQNQPGVYTRVSALRLWIYNETHI